MDIKVSWVGRQAKFLKYRNKSSATADRRAGIAGDEPFLPLSEANLNDYDDPS
jgi:hypothetical protein